MALATRVTVTYEDRYKNSVRVVFHVAAGIVDPNNAVIQAIVAAINACVNPIGLTIELTQVDVVVGTPVIGASYISTDKVLWIGLDENNQPHNWKVPGPDPVIFLPNDDNVDPANAAVIAYKAAVVANAKTRNNGAISVVTTGYRTASRKPLKN